MAAKKKLPAEQLDALHDSGAELSGYMNVQKARRPSLEIQRVNVDFPRWMIDSLDEEAGRLGVPRQSVIKFWISQCLEGRGRKRANSESSGSQQPTQNSG
jgi:hypothetical protein